MPFTLALPFLAATAVRYAGPVVLALLAPYLLGTVMAKAFFVMISTLLLGVTIGRLGVDNEILKGLGDPTRRTGLRWTVCLWLPATGALTVLTMLRWGPSSIHELALSPVSYVLIYTVLFLNSLIAALHKRRGATKYVQLVEFGSFQCVLALGLVITSHLGLSVEDRISAALHLACGLYGAYILLYVARNPAPFFHPEALGWHMLRERLNCFVPNMMTYVAAWGLLIPLSQVPPDLFNEVHAALRIATVAVAITAVAVLTGIADRTLTPLEAFRESRKVGIWLLLLASPIMVTLYAVARLWWPIVPDPMHPAIVLIYASHVASVVIGPTMFFANVVGLHARINMCFLGLSAIVLGVYVFPVPGLWGVLSIVVYTRVLVRIIVQPASGGLKRAWPR